VKCKFAWSHLDFKSGGYAPCFRFKRHNFKDSRFDKLPSEVINNSDFVKVREQLANDEWPDGCIDCKIQEESGILSYRERSLELEEEDDDWDNTTDVIITDLQFKLSRACNYNCRHCDSSSNSTFEKLGRKFPEIENELKVKLGFNHISMPKNKIEVPTPAIMDDLFENILPNIRTIEFSGGEPFYVVEMYKTLERMISDPNIDTSRISLKYNTNMSIIEYKGYKIEDLWKEFENIHVTCSMDGTGDLFNYFREGGDYQTVLSNMKHIAPWVDTFLLVCTTSAYHALYMNDIYNDLLEIKEDLLKITKPKSCVKMRTTFVHWPQVLDIVNLDDKIKNKIRKNTVKNEFTEEFLKRLDGKRTSDKSFKDLVKLQDKLYNRTPADLPDLWEYVYET
jgi:hypothetical protein